MNTERLRMNPEPLVGHRGWVTALAFCKDPTCTPDGPYRELLLSASRDKTVLIWELRENCREVSKPRASLHGHNGYINDVAVTRDGFYAATASDDCTVRVWDIAQRKKIHLLAGHVGDVMCVCFVGNSQIVSGSRDGSIKVWDMSGSLMHTFEKAHSNWVARIKSFDNGNSPIIVSTGWDKRIKVWDVTNNKMMQMHVGDDSPVNAVAISQDGSICASGSKLGCICLWDLSECKYCFSLDTTDVVNALEFSPERYWLSAATNKSVKIWDISTGERLLEDFKLEEPNKFGPAKSLTPSPLALTWSDDGNTLFVGYSDNTIRMLQME